MKRLFLTHVIAMLFAGVFAQNNNNLFWTMRVKVKMDKKLEWEKKAPAFMKAHYTNASFRVYEVTTGPNTGAYVLSVGPLSYKDMDTPPVSPKGEASLKNDAQALDAICESRVVTHYRKVDILSMENADRNDKYARLTFFEITVGSWEQVQAMQQKLKAARDSSEIKTDISCFRPLNSGPVNRFATVYYFERMEDLDTERNLEESYNKLHGKNAWYEDRLKFLSMVKSIETELWTFRRDLSTFSPVTASSN